MSDFLKDYQEYYRVRMERYENDVDYPKSYASEKSIYDAMVSCSDISESAKVLPDLSNKNAVALTIDEYTMRYNNYVLRKENIRALGPKRIVEKSPSYDKNVMDLITLVNEEENKNMIEISMDDISFVMNVWELVDQIQIYETADIPWGYKSDYQKFANETKESIRESYRSSIEENRKWQADWNINFDLIWEDRHRRNILSL
jgi:hypothetical protein